MASPPIPAPTIVARTVFACVALVCVTILGVAGSLASEAVTGVVTLLIGYVLGNGVLLTKVRRAGEETP